MLEGFEWDSKKAESNFAKHGISFMEAMTVFWDDFALMLPDHDHSIYEERFALLGMSKQLRTLVVVYCERGESIRIISARKATSNERKQYEVQNERRI